MKKFLTASILSLSILGAASFAEAKTVAEGQSQTMTTTTTTTTRRVTQPGRFRQVRVVTRTRTVRAGGRVYRETFQTRRFPNGRVVTRVISRVRVR